MSEVHRSDCSGLVDIGSGRSIHATCAGTGSPTVVLISGSRVSHELWHVIVPAGGGLESLVPDDSSVFDTVAATTRVCSYDRPGVPLLDGTMSTSSRVPQPTTAQQGAHDLAAWLCAAGAPAPYVLVAHSWGGLIAMCFAQDHPEEVAGLVLVDAASVQLRDALTPEQWQAFLDMIGPLIDGSDTEVPSYAGSVDLIANGPDIPRVPSVVLTADEPFDYGIGIEDTWPAWLAAQGQLASDLGARHVTETDSGHAVMVENPALVAHEVLAVVQAARRLADGPRGAESPARFSAR